jgi:hypothetical protein
MAPQALLRLDEDGFADIFREARALQQQRVSDIAGSYHASALERGAACWRGEREQRNGAALMRIAIARALLGLFVITTLGASLGACSHTWQGLKDDWHNTTGW